MNVTNDIVVRTPRVFVLNSPLLNKKIAKVALAALASVAILAFVKPPLSIALASVILVISLVDFLISKEMEVVRINDPNLKETIVVVPRKEVVHVRDPNPTVTVIAVPRVANPFPPQYIPRPAAEIREPVGRRLSELPTFVKPPQPVAAPRAAVRRHNEEIREQVGSRKEEEELKKQLRAAERVAVGSR